MQSNHCETVSKKNKKLTKLLNNNFEIHAAMELVRAGADPNTCDENGNTLIHKLTENLLGNVYPELCIQAIKELVKQHHADINIKNAEAVSAYQLILNAKPVPVNHAYLFLKLDAKFDEENKMGYPILHILGKRKKNTAPETKKALRLLSKKYDHNLQTQYGVLPIHQINASDVQQEKKPFGEGSFGKVYLGLWKDKQIAIKEMNQPQHSHFHIYGNEVGCLQQLTLKHAPNVIGFYGYYMDIPSMRWYIFMEYASNGSLRDLYKKTPWDEASRYKLIKDIVNGVSFMHENGYIHRDIKSDNILVDDLREAKVADFGLSTKVENSKDDACGTLFYKAPELLCNEPNSFPSDVYSLAITLSEVISWQTARVLMNIPENVEESIFAQWIYRGHHRPTLPPSCPPKLAGLITWGWKHNPQDRPSAPQLNKELQITPTDIDNIAREIDSISGIGTSNPPALDNTGCLTIANQENLSIDQMTQIARLINTTTEINKLVFDNTGFTNESLQIMTTALQNCHSLTGLSILRPKTLADCRIGLMVSNLLEVNRSITSLELVDCHIGAQCFRLSAVIATRNNNTLKTIKISDGTIQSGLSEMLIRNCTSLTHLELSIASNPNSGKELLSLLKTNRSLTTLKLMYNDTPHYFDAHVADLEQLFKQNDHMEVLVVNNIELNKAPQNTQQIKPFR